MYHTIKGSIRSMEWPIKCKNQRQKTNCNTKNRPEHLLRRKPENPNKKVRTVIGKTRSET